MQKFFNFILAAIVIIAVILSGQIIVLAKDNQKNKVDIAELNHIRYGLFSVDTWKGQITEIVIEEIDKLDLTTNQQKQLKPAIESQLNVLIDKVYERVKESNKGSLKGWAKQRLINTFVSLDNVKKGVPGYADAIILEMKKPKLKGKVKKILKDKIVYYLKHSYDTQDLSKVNAILAKTNSKNVDEARIKLALKISSNYDRVALFSLILFTLTFLPFFYLFMRKKPLSRFEFTCLVTYLLTLLSTGVLTPMIDLEARISKMSFVLMNNPVQFEDQVLFFQSKSIIDVFMLMIKHKDFEMNVVGVLLVVFSIIFPLSKLTSSILYYLNEKLRKNKYIKFFVLKSGKWSMADVMVIAIFMAYIGFNGVINSQLASLRTATPELTIMTTNGTSLQPGYYLFLTYALLSLYLTSLIKRKNS